ncbi:MAG: GNAT family N-acetyltransferase [candidate division KSB1 bacterium]|nr:GNAT family N-acetyltransferase [candidate division KSB1 bacterium]
MHELRTGGVSAVARYVAERLVRKNSFLVFVTDLHQPWPTYPCPDGYTVRLITGMEGRDIDRLLQFWMTFYADNYPLFYDERLVRKLLEARFAAGELCFVAEHGDDIAHFHWISRFGRCDLNREEPLKFLPFRPGRDAYAYNLFTRPDYRGKGLILATHSFLCEYLRQQGCEQVLTCVGIKNTASIKVHRRIAVQVGTLHVVRYLVFDRARMVPVQGG